MTAVATEVKRFPVNGVGATKILYRTSGGDLPEYVAVSAVFAPFSGDETLIFEADPAGNVVSWMDLPGSFRGAQDHERALRNAGYEVSR